MEVFYLGTPEVRWLEQTNVPLFVSQRRLGHRKKLPRALGRWALDSGGFSELTLFGKWKTSPEAYVEDVYRYREEIGNLDWAAPQDWMVEPQMIKRTGLSVYEHQKRTVNNYIRLRELAPDLPFVPVLQGWTVGDYFDHTVMYAKAGFVLQDFPLVGVGSVCRRQQDVRIAFLFHALADEGLLLHGFGLKKSGLLKVIDNVRSADSMAWSLEARFDDPLPGHKHQKCANCLEYALLWRENLLEQIDAGRGLVRHRTFMPAG